MSAQRKLPLPPVPADLNRQRMTLRRRIRRAHRKGDFQTEKTLSRDLKTTTTALLRAELGK